MLATGTIVGGYRIDGLLGEGGMGTVYRATQLSLERVVALKVLTGELSDDPGFRERFRREGLRQAAIDHPHIVSVYEAGETGEGLFLAMRLVEGTTLKALVLAGEIDVRRSLQILTQVADALDAAHAVGLVHRDVKPQNILIGAGDQAYLADFGLTKGSDEDGLLTEPGHFVGTIDYISPEQARGEGASVRSDVYSLCCVLHECLTREVPFPRPSEPKVLSAHLTEAPPTVSDRHPELPVAMDAVIAKGMAKDPDERYASAGALMLEARRAFAAVEPAAAPSQRTRMHRVEALPVLEAAAETLRTPRQAAPAPSVDLDETIDRPAAVVVPPPSPPGVPRAAAPRRRSSALALVGVLLVVAAVAGAVIGRGSSSPSATGPGGSSVLPNSASAGALELSFPAGWQRVTAAPRLPGVSFTSPLVLAPPPPAASRLEAGTVAASGPTLLPDGLLRLLPSPPSPTDRVRVGALEGLRYVGLRPRGVAGAVTLYTIPTTAGVLLFACDAEAVPAPAFAGDCAGVVASAKLVGASAFALGPSDTVAAALRAALGRLAGVRARAEPSLRAARTEAAQATAARTLASAYAGAALAVRAASRNPLVTAAAASLAAGLERLARAYRTAAAAAGANDAPGYRAAGRALGPAAAALGGGLAGLRALGYRVTAG